MKTPLIWLTACIMLFTQANKLYAQSLETIPAGAYIIDMGVTPQTIDNALKPYGLVYALTSDYDVPVKWSIDTTKAIGGVDFTYDSTDYKGGPFIITEDYRSATVDSVISSWESLGVVGVTTTSDITVPIQTTINFTIKWTLDEQNGGIAEGYLQNAGIPEKAYDWTLPEDLQCCNDVFVMPHADPTWVTHARLMDWNDSYENGGCEGAIWAACHAVSALENLFDPADTTVQMNFLSEKISGGDWTNDYADNSLVLWGDHGDGTPANNYAYGGLPPMQFLGDMDDAVENGSEQIYIPHQQWSSHTRIAGWDPDHAEASGSQIAAILAFGQAFGDEDRGKVMYQAGHSHDGSDPDNIAAMRAMLNFSLWAASDKSIEVDAEVDIDSVIVQGIPAQASVAASGGTGTFTYSWSSSCEAIFSNPDSSTTDYIATFADTCFITCIITDACGRKSYTRSMVVVTPNPCQPVEGADYIGGTLFKDINSNAVYDTTFESLINFDIDLDVFLDANDNGILDGSEGDSAISTISSSNGEYAFELIPPYGPSEFFTDSTDALGDDAIERTSGQVINDDSKLAVNATSEYSALRFTGVDIPRGAVILNAYVEFYASDNRNAAADFEISVQKSTTPAAFVEVSNNISDRYDTTSIVAWDDVESWTKNSSHNTPDISSLIQNSVEQISWNNGQAIVLMFRHIAGGERKAYSFDGDEENSPRLYVEYSPQDYPVSYILAVNDLSLPTGGGVTTFPSEQAFSYTGPYQAHCGYDFGIVVNRAIAVDDINVTVAGIPTSGNVLVNDIDPEMDSLIFSSFLDQDGSGDAILSGATLEGIDTSGAPVANAGTITFANGGYVYTPQAGFSGEVDVDYAMLDDGFPPALDTATLNIIVTIESNPNLPGDNSMMAINDYNMSFGNPVRGNLLANDIDPELDAVSTLSYVYDSDADAVPDLLTTTFSQALSVGGIDPYKQVVADAGSIIIHANGSYTFTPEPGFEGRVTIDYTACDDVPGIYNRCTSARLLIDVATDNNLLDNDPPFAGDDYGSTLVNTPVTRNWISNDDDPNGDDITVNGEATIIDFLSPGPGNELGTYTTQQGGSLIMFDDGTYTYTPPTDYYGSDYLNYFICDDTASPLCDSATIHLLISPMYYDYGDLPAQYPTAGHLVALLSNGNYIPNKQGSFWLGQFVDAEPESKPSTDATGDNSAESNDEQGLIIPPFNEHFLDIDQMKVHIVLNGTEPGMEVFYGLWIDWGYDGEFEYFYNGSGVIGESPTLRAALPDTVQQWIDLPTGATNAMVGFRLRVFSALPDSSQFTGGTRNGEVEDYFKESNTILPVELTRFDAEAIGNDAALTWQTASEINNDYFSIQRSQDGVNWTEIGMVDGHGNSTAVNDYAWTDPGLSAGEYYYRLQQFDFDGTSDYSRVDVVVFDRTSSLGSTISIYPNPASISSDLSVKGLGGEPAEVAIYSMNGHVVSQISMGENSHIDLAREDLTAGLYLVEVYRPGKVDSFKLVVK